MIFPVMDSSIEKRKAMILRQAKQDLEVGFLLAEFNLEWIMRRMILKFTKCPTLVVRAAMLSADGISNYCRIWELYVVPFGYAKMHEILGIRKKVAKSEMYEYVKKRHVLVHGARGGIGVVNALVGLKMMLDMAEKLMSYAQQEGVKLFEPLDPRVKCRCLHYSRKRQRPTFESNGCPSGIYPDGNCRFAEHDMKKSKMRNDRSLDDKIAEIRKATRGKSVSNRETLERIQKIAFDLGLQDSDIVQTCIQTMAERISKKAILKEKKERFRGGLLNGEKA